MHRIHKIQLENGVEKSAEKLLGQVCAIDETHLEGAVHQWLLIDNIF